MLEIDGVHKTFHAGTPNEVRALQGVSLTIEPGSFVIVIGTNGSGKTTLLNAVAGTFRPDAGRVRLAGYDITDWPEHRRAMLVGRAFQNPFSGTAPGMTVAENLALAARRGCRRTLGWWLRGSQREDMRTRVRKLNMGLEGRLDNAMGSLSGGQRQALTLLMATWLKPEEREVELGRALVQQVFKISRVGSVAGCRVLSGVVERNSRARIVRNSTIIAVTTTVGSLVLGCLGAYALARLRFPGRSVIARGLIFTYLVPQSLLFIPLFAVTTLERDVDGHYVSF